MAGYGGIKKREGLKGARTLSYLTVPKLPKIFQNDHKTLNLSYKMDLDFLRLFLFMTCYCIIEIIDCNRIV